MPAEHWWFWGAIALVAMAAVGAAGRWRTLMARVRRRALGAGIVEAGGSTGVDTQPGGFWAELSWTRVLLGAWIAAGPWIWGYDDSSGAIATDVSAGAVILAGTMAGIVFPAVLVLPIAAGTWLLVAPWLVGYADDAGAASLSDVLCGLAVVATAIADMASAARRVTPGEPRPVARTRSRGE